MKRILFPIVLAMLIVFSPGSFAQQQTVENEVNKKIEEGIGKLFGRKKKKTTPPAEPVKTEQVKQESKETSKAEENKTPQLEWAKYDFVPGDKVIFEDDLIGEENGEFPSRWDLVRGTAEVAKVDGENVIFLRGGQPTIVPYLENSTQDYLPDVFTIEFDVYFGYIYFEVYLYDSKNQKRSSGSSQYRISVSYNALECGSAKSTYPSQVEQKRWAHISIAYTNGKFKAYLDDTRLVNIPRMEINPTGLSFYSYHANDEYPIYIKNVRIAKGGVKYYDRVLQDGKIIANGIRFDLGKASLKSESMGVINEIYELMDENPELNFSVEGHTDSQGNDDFNLQLSQDRSETVMNTLIKMGISADRLSAKGWGESKPITNNASPEDRANNRRVEFVKVTN